MTQPDPADLARRLADLATRHTAEIRLVEVAGAGGGISGLVRETSEMSGHALWLIDPQGRVVSRSVDGVGGGLAVPRLSTLLGDGGPVDPARTSPLVIEPRPAADITRRHLVMPVSREGVLFAWLVVAETPGRFTAFVHVLVARAAYHLTSEYVTQRRVARVSWNARATLARQMVRGSVREEDLRSSAEYLGVDATAHRVIVYLSDPDDAVEPLDEEVVADEVSRVLGVEVLGTRGNEGTVLLVEAPVEVMPVVMVGRVKAALSTLVASLGPPSTIVGVSAVARPGALHRAYREAREVVHCVDRFAHESTRVISVDDLGPARLFVANSDVDAVRRYVHDVLGSLLSEMPSTRDLLRTLQCFFSAGRSVRESAAQLGIHENTVRLRLAKVHDLTGLDVAADPNDQLSAQTALLVLRLEGHPFVPPFDALREGQQRVTA